MRLTPCPVALPRSWLASAAAGVWGIEERQEDDEREVEGELVLVISMNARA